jgi:murein L,D-transpeptidase YcbB/YkuD
VSSKYENESDQFLLGCLSNIHSASELKKLMDALQPREKGYQFLKQELKLQKHNNDREKIRQLAISLNYFRWIHHFKIEKAIVVNIGSAYLRYYENDSMILFMKVVVGKPSTPTPRFAAWCDQAVLYPYWYVPRKIALNEYVNRFKRNPALIDAMNMQIIDDSGRVLNHYKLNWSAFSKSYFPYTLRQSTGCDNALGVIKFNLTSPYGVYLHDTNVKTAFFSGYRYYSHGCIRIEEPVELGNRLLNNTLDTTFLQSCFKEQKPIPIQLEKPVPVFVVYMPVEASNSGSISYYKDVYKLLK